MQTVSLTHLAKGRSNLAHGEKEQADDRHLEQSASRDEEPTNRQWNPEGVGRNLFDSFGVLGLGFGATEMEVKTAYRMLALRYHPDKNDPEITGMNRDQATAHFQLDSEHSELISEIRFVNFIFVCAPNY